MSFNELLSVAVSCCLNSCSIPTKPNREYRPFTWPECFRKTIEYFLNESYSDSIRDSIDIFSQIIHAANETVKRLASMINTSPKDKLLLNEQKKKLSFTVLAEILLQDYLASSSNLSFLHCRFCSPEDLALSVSIWTANRRNHIDQFKIWLTVFFSNALARCCAPPSPISFCCRSSVVSAYSECQS